MLRSDSPTAITFLLEGIGIGALLTLLLQRYRPATSEPVAPQDPIAPHNEESALEFMERTGRAV